MQRSSSAAGKQAAGDCLLEYHFEGQGSSAGSVGCCSLQESDNDLQFLDDLGPRFKTLAEICSPPTPQTCRGVVIPEADEVELIAEPSLDTKPTSVYGKSPERKQEVTMGQSFTRVTGSHGASSTAECGLSSLNSSSMALSPHFTSTMLPPPGHVLLLQRCTNTPVLQPMHYVAQHQVQSPLLLAETPVTNLPDVILVNARSEHTERGEPGETLP